jgi:hypothetical protein
MCIVCNPSLTCTFAAIAIDMKSSECHTWRETNPDVIGFPDLAVTYALTFKFIKTSTNMMPLRNGTL